MRGAAGEVEEVLLFYFSDLGVVDEVRGMGGTSSKVLPRVQGLNLVKSWESTTVSL